MEDAMLITAFDQNQKDLDALKAMVNRISPDSEMIGFTELKDCVNYASQNAADLVFFEKTGGSGWYRIVEAIHSLKSVNPRMDFIILHRSSNTYNEVYWAVRSRVSAFLPKPVEYRQLETEFQNLFYHHK